MGMSFSSTGFKKEHWFIFQGDRLLFVKNGEDAANYHLAITGNQFICQRQHTLGHINGIACFCAEIDPASELPDWMVSIPLRKAFDILGPDWYTAATKAFSVINWDRNHQFCGHCGSPTRHKSGSFERICEQCGLVFYPRISPSMIVLIKKDDHLLMARSPHFATGIYGLIAGFIEIGESIEEAVHREVKEEVSIEIKNLRYFGSQPWPFPDSLMIGFTADYAAGEIQIDNNEIEAAAWYRFDNLPGRPSTNVSIASKLIQHFVAAQSQKSLK